MISNDTLRLENIFSKITTSRLFWVVSFSILTAVAAQIAIPVKPVPFTLQTMMVVLSGAFLGARYGALSQILYLFIGAIGLPVFAQTPDGALGFARLLGPTGGYLLAFPLGAFITGYIIENRSSYFMVVLAMLAGDAVIVVAGAFYLYTFFIGELSQALTYGAAIFSVWTVAKVLIAASVFTGVNKLKKS